MKKISLPSVFIFFMLLHQGLAQTNRVMDLFPKGTVLHGNINYNNDTLGKHLLDLYLPARTTGKIPLIIFVHGGGWQTNDKYADMGYMKKTVAEIVNSGYALASIDYRFSTQAVFPAQIQDCNKAVSFLFDKAETYGLDRDRFAVMGFSAGGHLASLMGLSNNDSITDFYMPGTNGDFYFKAVVDFYGPTDLTLFPHADDANSAEGLLLGASPVARPDLARAASPISYVDEKDPPFLIVHGERDDMVAPRHSQLLGSWLTVKGVDNKLILVKDAPHYGEMFDTDEVRIQVMDFLKRHLGE
ncbi:MAG: alpha/beta hydrolase [Sediminicola sp.]